MFGSKIVKQKMGKLDLYATLKSLSVQFFTFSAFTPYRSIVKVGLF